MFDFGPLAETYDRWYETPAGRAHDRQQKALVRTFLPPARGPGRSLLDVGCGTGHWSRFFASLGYEVVGVDVSGPMIHRARANHSPPCLFERADACSLPFDSAAFDVVAAMAALEFTRDPRRALKEMVRCVRPSGRVIIGSLNRLSPINAGRLAGGKQPYASAKMFAPEQLREMLLPFGRVRLAVSAAVTRAGKPGPDKPVVHARRGHGRPWRGAFIVAEVRPPGRARRANRLFQRFLQNRRETAS